VAAERAVRIVAGRQRLGIDALELEPQHFLGDFLADEAGHGLVGSPGLLTRAKTWS
jgi:hypothetical protein